MCCRFWSLSRVLMLVATFTAAAPAYGGDGCTLVAEITVEGIQQGSLAVCLQTGHPVACAIASACEALSKSPAAKPLAKKGVEAGCNFVVTKLGDKLEIHVEASPDKSSDVQKTEKALDTIKDIRWRERKVK